MDTPATLALIAGFALGHACLVVLAINTIHGLDFHSKHSESIILIALGLIGLASLAALGWIARHPDPRGWPPGLRLYAGACLLVGPIGLPAITAARALRRDPDGIALEARPADPPDGLAGEGCNAGFHRVPGNQALRLRVVSWRVEVPGLPGALHGLRIAHLTDLHMSPAYKRRYFEHVADEATRAAPDLVLCTGDLIEDRETIGWIGPVLGRVPARLGRYAILGNHDLLYGEDRVREAVAAAGYEDVEGRWARLEVGDATLALGGTAAPWGRPLGREEMPEADWRIVLSHSPDRFYRVAAWDAVDLMLCGHNHGGQVRLPVIGPVLMPSLYSRRFDRGYFRRGRTLMYVGQGIGAKHPLRLNCPPELAILELHPAPTRLPAGQGMQAEATALRGPGA